MNQALYARFLENLIKGIASSGEIYARISTIEKREKQWGEIKNLAYTTWDVYEGFFSAGLLRRGYPVMVLSEALLRDVPDFRIEDDFHELVVARQLRDEPSDASFPIATLRHVLDAIPSELYDASFSFALNRNMDALTIAKNAIGRLVGVTEDAWQKLQNCPRYADDRLIEKFEQSLLKCHKHLRETWRRLSTEIHRTEQLTELHTEEGS